MKKNSTKLVRQIRDVSFQIRALAHVISMQKAPDIVPLDIEDLNYGLGVILDRLGAKVWKIANQIEDPDDSI